MYKRLTLTKDFLLEHYKKDAKKSKNASKITKALKKIFNPERKEDLR